MQIPVLTIQMHISVTNTGFDLFQNSQHVVANKGSDNINDTVCIASEQTPLVRQVYMKILLIFAWDAEAVIPQSLVHSSGRELPSPAIVEGEVTQMAKTLSKRALETTGTVVRETKSDFVNCHHEDGLCRANQINELEILRRDICDAHALSLA